MADYEFQIIIKDMVQSSGRAYPPGGKGDIQSDADGITYSIERARLMDNGR